MTDVILKSKSTGGSKSLPPVSVHPEKNRNPAAAPEKIIGDSAAAI